MRSIYITAIVTRKDLVQFHEELSKAIDKIQNDGCEVEIQYAPTDTSYSALIIGYKESK